jgi:hypothetical protein
LDAVTALKEGLIKTIAYFEDLIRESGTVNILGES